MAGIARNGIDSSAPILSIVSCGVVEIMDNHEVDPVTFLRCGYFRLPAKPPWPSYLRSAGTAMLHFHSTIESVCCFGSPDTLIILGCRLSSRRSLCASVFVHSALRHLILGLASAGISPSPIRLRNSIYPALDDLVVAITPHFH
jgi:hypothetical protein